MKKIIAFVLVLLVVISGLFIVSATQAEAQTETQTEIIQKEITEINVSVEHNNITINFDDNTYIQTSMNNFFFTKTYQKECIIKKYDENKNLVYIYVFYNPNTTEF